MLKYVIIQAGGKGTRLGKYTFNKPKALLSINGRPLILNTMSTFHDAFFIIIGDYKYEVLRDYLRTFTKEKYVLLRANSQGTCAGLQEALRYIPSNTPFILTWCDLYFDSEYKLPEISLNKSYVGLSGTFKCRWSFKDSKFVEEPSVEHGVAGFFIFPEKSIIQDVPKEGEFVKYLSNKRVEFKPITLHHVHEYGTEEEYEKLLDVGVSRPFNKITMYEDKVIKEPVDKKGLELARLENLWYEYVQQKDYKKIPKIYSTSPLTLQRLDAVHPFEKEPSEMVLRNIVSALNELHCIQSKDLELASYYREYYQKTFERLYQVKNIIPLSNNENLKINGKAVPNPFYIEEDISKELEKYYKEEFTIIHGDPTFSNTLVDKENNVWFIDPRGYFGYTEVYGDPDYDFAKVYYSLVGNYDKFIRKKFKLKINDFEAELKIESNGYERFEELFFEIIGKEKKEKIKLLHAIIWLSLTTYAWDDFDMICGAFYNGALKLAEVLR